jgi:hypothetical protein
MDPLISTSDILLLSQCPAICRSQIFSGLNLLQPVTLSDLNGKPDKSERTAKLAESTGITYMGEDRSN